MSIEKNILRLFEQIDSSKNFINEVLSDSSQLFGGTNVRIPADGSHAGQSGWPSGNAWDIFAPAGTPVYSISDGILVTFNDYGPKVIKTASGKKLFGQGFTVQTNDKLPDLFYTHLEGSTVRNGSIVKCGQLLGYIMNFPGGSDHVHIGVETGGNIRQFLNDDGTIKCSISQEIIGSEVDDFEFAGGVDVNDKEIGNVDSKPTDNGNIDVTDKEEFEYGGWKKDPKISENINQKILQIYEEIKKSGKLISESITLNESSTFSPPLSRLQVTSPFGPRWGRHHNGVDLAANAENVKSLSDGIVSYVHEDEYPCGGTIKIEHSDGYTTGFCHIQKIYVDKGQMVKKGDVIGISGGGLNDPGKGRSDGRHLHLTIKKNGEPVDPMEYIGKEGVLSGEEMPSSSFVTDVETPDSTDNNDVTSIPSNDKEDFGYGGWKKDSKISENIERIKNLL